MNTPYQINNLMKPILITLLFIALSTTVYGQSNQDKAKAYFKQANTEFTQQKYSVCIATLNKVEGLLGKSNAMISSLRTKAYYNSNEFSKAKTELNAFFKYKASDKLKNEMLTYIIKIDDKLEEKEQDRQAEIAAEKQRQEKESLKRKIQQQDKDNWNIALKENTISSYNSYLNNSNNNNFRDKANSKIKLLKLQTPDGLVSFYTKHYKRVAGYQFALKLSTSEVCEESTSYWDSWRKNITFTDKVNLNSITNVERSKETVRIKGKIIVFAYFYKNGKRKEFISPFMRKNGYRKGVANYTSTLKLNFDTETNARTFINNFNEFLSNREKGSKQNVHKQKNKKPSATIQFNN